MTIKISEITIDYYSGVSGLKVGKYIDKLILENIEQPLFISFYGISSIAPSFINGCLLYIIDLYGVEYFKKNIKIIEVSSNFLELVKNTIIKHFEYKKSFLSNLKAFNYFIATDGSVESNNIRNYISKINSTNNINLKYNEDKILSANVQHTIKKSECVIAILSDKKYKEFIIEQCDFALKNDIPCILLIKKGMYLKINDKIKDKILLLRFDNTNIIKTIRVLNKIILMNIVKPVDFPVKRGKNNNSDNLIFWGGLAFLSDLLIGSILSGNKK